MIEFVAYLAAQERTAEHARSALPTAPTLPTAETPRREARRHLLRRRLSMTLRRMADLLEPAPDCGGTAIAGSR